MPNLTDIAIVINSQPESVTEFLNTNQAKLNTLRSPQLITFQNLYEDFDRSHLLVDNNPRPKLTNFSISEFIKNSGASQADQKFLVGYAYVGGAIMILPLLYLGVHKGIEIVRRKKRIKANKEIANRQ